MAVRSRRALCTIRGICLETVTGTGSDRVAVAAPRRDGFGHVAFGVHDVQEFSDELESAGVKFQSPEVKGQRSVAGVQTKEATRLSLHVDLPWNLLKLSIR